MKLAQRIEDVLTTLYDYEYIDIEKFYNDRYNTELLEVLNKVIDTGDYNKSEEKNVIELYDILDNFIKFETNYNSEIGDF